MASCYQDFGYPFNYLRPDIRQRHCRMFLQLIAKDKQNISHCCDLTLSEAEFQRRNNNSSILCQVSFCRKNMEREDQKPSLNSPLIEISEETLNNQTCTEKRKVIFEEVKKQLWLAGPLISVSLLQYCLQMISVMFVGHLGELPLSGASMATSFASVTGFSLLVSGAWFINFTYMFQLC